VEVLSALTVNDNVDLPSITMWAQLQDVSLGEVYDDFTLPTCNPSVPSLYTEAFPLKFPLYTVHNARGSGPSTVTEHSRTVQEGAAKEQGSLSRVAHSASSLFSSLTPFVFPSFMAGASFVSSSLGNVLQRFNLDKPVERKLPDKVVKQWKDLHHSDGLDQCRHLGLKTDNTVYPVGKDQPFNLEEASLANIASCPQLIAARTMSTADEARKVLINYAVAPWNVPCSKPINVTPTEISTMIHHSYASFLSNCFAFWRGTCCVSIHVMAQAFSKAYIGVIWTPGEPGPLDLYPSSSTIPGSFNTKRTHIFEINGPGQYDFEIPYLSDEYMLNSNISLRTTYPGTSPSANGYFSIFVVNPLTNFSATPTAATIDLLMYVGWKDLEFFRPITSQLSALSGPATFTFAPDPPEVTEHSLEMMGETVDSVYDLIRRPGFLAAHPQAPDDHCTVASLFTTLPVSYQLPAPDDSPFAESVAMDRPFGPCNFLSYLSRIYLTWRGEVSYHILNFTDSVDNIGASSESNAYIIGNVSSLDSVVDTNYANGPPINLVPVLPPSSSVGAFGSGAIYRPINTPDIPLAVTTPFYSPRQFYLTPEVSIGDNGRLYPADWNKCAMPAVRIAPIDRSTNGFQLLVSASDSFSLGMLYPPSPSTHLFMSGKVPLTTTLTKVIPD
jgi:hypothetical protein